MPDSKIIFLIGMPATGKTYWGEKIAHRYKLHFIDLDRHVAEQERASIPALFAQYGEKGFREREHKCLEQIVTTNEGNTIVACGGGTPCFLDNMQLMKNAGTVIYIDTDIPALLKRITEDTEVRPLLNNRADLEGYLKDLLGKRKPFYEQAHHILHTKNISLTTFDQIITVCINGH